MKQNYFLGLLMYAILSAGLLSANISCNERMKHLPKGLGKGAVALAFASTAVYFGLELREAIQPLFTRIPARHLPSGKERNALIKTGFLSCALVALGYTTWQLGSSSIESFGIFLDDDEEETADEEVSMPVEEPSKNEQD